MLVKEKVKLTCNDDNFAFDSPETCEKCVYPFLCGEDVAHCPAESPAMRRIFGIFSNMPASGVGVESCSLSCCSRCLGTEVIMTYMCSSRK